MSHGLDLVNFYVARQGELEVDWMKENQEGVRHNLEISRLAVTVSGVISEMQTVKGEAGL